MMNTQNLKQFFLEKLHEIKDTLGGNPYLDNQKIFLDYIIQIEESTQDSTLGSYLKDLHRTLNKPASLVDVESILKLIQDIGEAYFYALALSKGIKLRKIPETKHKNTPDFECLDQENNPFYFEVKTLSVVSPITNIPELFERSMNAQISLDQQLKAGKRVAMAEVDITPWETNDLREMIHIGINKIQNNIKTKQFADKPTFLVINLSNLPLFGKNNDVIMPYYTDHHKYITTGELWTMACGEIGMLIKYHPSVEGHQCISGTLQSCGILRNPAYDCIAGILFIHHDLHNQHNIYGFYRDDDFGLNTKELKHCSGNIYQILKQLHGKSWNDMHDSNTFALINSLDNYTDEEVIAELGMRALSNGTQAKTFTYKDIEISIKNNKKS